jgi:predicted transcriptional regulator
MSKPTIILQTNDSFERAISVILSRRLPTCVVTTATGEYVGELDDSGVIRAWILAKMGKKMKTVNDTKVCWTLAPTVTRSATIQQVVKKVFSSKSQRVYVVDANQKLLGLIRPKELLRFLLGKISDVPLAPNKTSREELVRHLGLRLK